MKKILSVMLTLCLCANISFAAFDPYADEEVEKKSYKKLYYGIALTLLGGFLTYDGFSTEEVDVSKPSVDYTTVSHSEWVIVKGSGDNTNYQVRSGISLNNVSGATGDYTKYEIDDVVYNNIESNRIYNNGNVDLENITIEVRYKFKDGTYIGPQGQHVKTDGYHTAETNSSTDPGVPSAKYENITLAKGDSIPWQDLFRYTSNQTDTPSGSPRGPYVNTAAVHNDGTTGLNLGKDSNILMDVRIVLNKNQQYKPIYEKRHKSDAEGVAGLLVGITGIYFIVDHFIDMHKFNAYAKRHNLNLRVTTASNEYKLMLQKRI